MESAAIAAGETRTPGGAELAKALGGKIVIVFGYALGGYGDGEVPVQREAVEDLAEKMTAEGAERAKHAGHSSEKPVLVVRP